MEEGERTGEGRDGETERGGDGERERWKGEREGDDGMGREREGRERDREEGGIEGVREGREKWTGHYRNGSLHTCI